MTLVTGYINPLSTVGIQGPALLTLSDLVPPKPCPQPACRHVDAQSPLLCSEIIAPSPKLTKSTLFIKQNENILQDTETQGRFWTRIGISTFQNFPQLSQQFFQAQTWQGALKVNMNIKVPDSGTFPPTIRMLQRSYSC